MSGRYLLDTNIVIAIFANDTKVVQTLQKAQEILIPSIVLGELFYGARNSTQTSENLARIEAFHQANVILVCDAATAAIYGQIKAELKQRGAPIPENDIWIAAIANQYALTLVSRDKHFGHITNIKYESWS